MNYSLILAGGEGKRFSAKYPKQLHKINNKEIIAYTIEHFQKCNVIDKIIIGSNIKYIEQIKTIINNYHFTKVDKVFVGGNSFWNSVYLGFQFLEQKYSLLSNDIIMVHGACCPLVNEDIIVDSIKIAKEHGASVSSPNVSVSTWHINNSGYVDDIIKRNSMKQIHFPFSFKYNILKDSFFKINKMKNQKNSGHPVFDNGYKMFLSKGAYENIKITTHEDIDFVKKFLN